MTPTSALLLFLAACTPDYEVEVEIEDIPTVATLSWTSPDAQEAWVEYGLDEALDMQTPVQAASTEHAITLLGMKAGYTYLYRAVQREGGVQTVVAEGELELEPPPVALARLAVIQSVEGAHEGGYVLTTQLSPDEAWVVIYDREGDPVWFVSPDASVSIPTARPSIAGQFITFVQNDRERTEDVGGTQRVSLDGTDRVHTRNLMGHHDFAETPDGKVAWISFTAREVDVEGYDEPQRLTADRILEAPLGTTDVDDY